MEILAVITVSMILSATTHFIAKRFGVREQITSSVQDAAFESLSKKTRIEFSR